MTASLMPSRVGTQGSCAMPGERVSPGNQGNAWDDELNAYLNSESIDFTDVVLWYCGHLFHAHHDGGDEWHAGGRFCHRSDGEVVP